MTACGGITAYLDGRFPSAKRFLGIAANELRFKGKGQISKAAPPHAYCETVSTVINLPHSLLSRVITTIPSYVNQ